MKEQKIVLYKTKFKKTSFKSFQMYEEFAKSYQWQRIQQIEIGEFNDFKAAKASALEIIKDDQKNGIIENNEYPNQKECGTTFVSNSFSKPLIVDLPFVVIEPEFSMFYKIKGTNDEFYGYHANLISKKQA